MKAQAISPSGEEGAPILLVVASWRERALLLAELQERGYPVRALPGIIHAVGYLIRHPDLHPRLVILDVAADPEISERTLADLLELTAPAPWILVGSSTRKVPGQETLPLSRVHLLQRPVRVRDIVALAATLLGTEGTHRS